MTLIITQVDSSPSQAKPQTATLVEEEKKPRADASSPRKRHGVAASVAASGIETLTYRDPFAGVYKKYVRKTLLPFVPYSHR
jgi:nitrite reductase (NAD(P)H)